MCRAADAAMAMVNRSIELAKEYGDESYYMDFVKLHKLMYLAQCAMLTQYEQPLFVEQVTAHQCGPYVEGLHFVPGERGFGKITVPFSRMDFVRPSYRRMKIIEEVLDAFGRYDTEELIDCTRDTAPYRTVADQIDGNYRPRISQELMSQLTSQSVG